MKERMPFVIQGNFRKEFLESMGYKPFVPAPIEISKDPVMPIMHIVEGLFPKCKYFNDKNIDATTQNQTLNKVGHL
jgi:hypothetical protein